LKNSLIIFQKIPVSQTIPKKKRKYYLILQQVLFFQNRKSKDLSIESEFQNKKNNIFEQQFNKQLKDFVLHTQWIPARISGLNVDSYYDSIMIKLISL
jgi:hypothetical protein